MTKKNGDAVSVREFYDKLEQMRLENNRAMKDLDTKIMGVDTKVETVAQNVANINGRMYYLPTIISTAIGTFTVVITRLLAPQSNN